MPMINRIGTSGMRSRSASKAAATPRLITTLTISSVVLASSTVEEASIGCGLGVAWVWLDKLG